MSIETEEIKEEDIFISEKVDKSIDKINGVMGVVAIAIVFFIIFLLIVGMFANQLKNYSG